MEEHVRRIIEQEIASAFDANADLEDLINTYEQFSYLNIPVEKGIQVEWISTIERFYQFGDSTGACHQYLLNSESFLKKLLYVVSREKYEDAVNGKNKGLYKTMEYLGLLKEFPLDTNLTKSDPYSFNKLVQRAIVSAYQLRNTSSHTATNWSISQMTVNIKAVLITTCYAVWLNRTILNKTIQRAINHKEYDLNGLMKRIKQDYDKEISQGFKYVSLGWILESDQAGKAYEHQMSISELLPDKQLMLIGDAGCGKSTALNWLEYISAKAYLTAESQSIPVKIQMAELESTHMTIEDMVCNRLGIPLDYCYELLKGKLIYLLLDGLNEIPGGLENRRATIRKINTFIAIHPDVFLIISDRKNTVFSPNIYKKYTLKKMTKDEVLMYAQSRKNCTASVKSKINSMFNLPAYSSIEYTPLLINQLVDVLSAGKDIPEDPTELIGVYIQSVLARECNEKQSGIAAPGKLDLLLSKLAVSEMPDEGIPLPKVLKLFKTTLDEYGLNYNTDECVELAKQLGFLEQTGNRIVFKTEDYRVYFLMQAMDYDL